MGKCYVGHRHILRRTYPRYLANVTAKSDSLYWGTLIIPLMHNRGSWKEKVIQFNGSLIEHWTRTQDNHRTKDRNQCVWIMTCNRRSGITSATVACQNSQFNGLMVNQGQRTNLQQFFVNLINFQFEYWKNEDSLCSYFFERNLNLASDYRKNYFEKLTFP